MSKAVVIKECMKYIFRCTKSVLGAWKIILKFKANTRYSGVLDEKQKKA